MKLQRLYKYIRIHASGAISLTLGTSFILQFLNIITGIIIARLLGPTGKGQLTAAMLWPTLMVALGSLGIMNSITYFAAKKPQDTKKIFATSTMLALLQSAILIGIGLFLVPNVLKNQSSSVVKLSRIYLAYIPLTLLTLYLQSILGAHLKFFSYNTIRVIYVASSLVFMIALIFYDSFDIKNILIAYLASNILTLIYAVISAWRYGYISLLPNGELIKPILAYGLKSHLSGVALSLNERFDQLMISAFLPAVELGLYAVSVTLTTPIVLVGISIANVAFPAISGVSTIEDQMQQLGRYARITLWLSLIMAFVLLIFSESVLQYVFGPDYLPAAPVTKVLVLAAIPLSLNRVFQAGLKAVNEPLIAGIAEGMAVIVTIVLLLILLSPLGIIAAGVVSLIAYTSSWIFMFSFFNKKYHARLSQFIVPGYQEKKIIRSVWQFIAGLWR